MTRYFAKPLLPLLLLGGCAAGPDYVPPVAPPVQRYTAEALPPVTVATPVAGGAAQRFAPGEAAPERWWTSFGSSNLNALVDAALAANPDLQAAQAALLAAQENRAAQHGAYLPTLDVQLAPARQRVASTLSSPTASGANLYTLHTAQLNVGYVADVFGGVGRQVEAADAQTEGARYQAQAVRLTLIANLVAAAISEAALQAQLETTQELAHLARQQLDAVRRQQQVGQVGPAEVAAQAGVLAQVEASVPALEKQLAQQRNVLAVLSGRLPADEALPRLQFDSLSLSDSLPLSLPAQLVQQRPDIRAAEAQLHASSALIGVATAARLPVSRSTPRWAPPRSMPARCSDRAAVSGASAPTCCNRCSGEACCCTRSVPRKRHTHRRQRSTAAWC